MIIYAIISTAFLVSFGSALVWYDAFKKLEKLRDEEHEDAAARDAKNAEAISARDAMLAHWCNEAIQLQRQLQSTFAEKRRWEQAYAAKLPRSYN